MSKAAEGRTAQWTFMNLVSNILLNSFLFVTPKRTLQLQKKLGSCHQLWRKCHYLGHIADHSLISLATMLGEMAQSGRTGRWRGGAFLMSQTLKIWRCILDLELLHDPCCDWFVKDMLWRISTPKSKTEDKVVYMICPMHIIILIYILHMYTTCTCTTHTHTHIFVCILESLSYTAVANTSNSKTPPGMIRFEAKNGWCETDLQQLLEA